jgi:hypothetical protein
VLAFKYLQHPFAADLTVVWHKTQPVLPAAIDTASYVVQVTDDGDCVTRAIYAVRNNRKQFLELKLPGGEKTALWSSFVGDKPVKPSKANNGAILLPLEKSSYAGAELNSFNVEVIYYSSLGAALHPLGGIYLALPEVDLPISRSMLTVFAPGRFAYTRVGGAMREPYGAPVTTTGWFGELAKDKKEEKAAAGAPGAKPAAPASKVDLLSLRESGRRDDAEKQQAEAEQVFQTRIRAAHQAQDMSGALPARFSVPQEGVPLRFEELITIGEASTLRLFYCSRSAISFFAFLACVLMAALAWFARSLLSGGADRRRGLKIFGAGAAAIVLLTVVTGSTWSVVAGAALGGGARFVQWCVIQIARQQAKARGAQ